MQSISELLRIFLKMLATNFYKSFFKNVLLYMNGGLSSGQKLTVVQPNVAILIKL